MVTHPQRGLSLFSPLHTLYTRLPTAGSFTIYLMRVYCYQTWSSIQTQEQLWLCADAICAMPAGCCRFYIREDRRSFALLLDPTMRHIAHLDYYI